MVTGFDVSLINGEKEIFYLFAVSKMIPLRDLFNK